MFNSSVIGMKEEFGIKPRVKIFGLSEFFEKKLNDSVIEENEIERNKFALMTELEQENYLY